MPPGTTSNLPEKHIADDLVDDYLRTSESIYRVLHIPTFMRDYEAVWIPNSKPSATFLVLLKLVLAIGAVAHDTNFSLRPNAVTWVYEALSWYSEPRYKSRLTLQSLQAQTLLLIARDAVEIGSDQAWVSVGELIHFAIHLGMHKDPYRLGIQSPLAIEIRRRLWNTILEVGLQFSLASGSPLLISHNDFDTEPPGNYDDEQLANTTTTDATNYGAAGQNNDGKHVWIPLRFPQQQQQGERQQEGKSEHNSVPEKPETTFTQSSIAILLHKTFSIRLAIVKFLNGLDSSQCSYEETLRLDARLRDAYDHLNRTVQTWIVDRPESISHSRFEFLFLDFIFHRFLSSLHVPFLFPALHESGSRYAFSRQAALDAALKMWCIVNPASSLTGVSTSPAGSPRERIQIDKDSGLARIIRCGYRTLLSAGLQAFMIIPIELRTQLRQPRNLGPIPVRRDLLAVVEEGSAFSFSCIEAGQTNIKCYLVPCMLLGQINGIMMRLDQQGVSDMAAKAAEEAVDRCLSLLERAAGNQVPTPVRSDIFRDDPAGIDNALVDFPQDFMEDWDFIVCLSTAYYHSTM